MAVGDSGGPATHGASLVETGIERGDERRHAAEGPDTSLFHPRREALLLRKLGVETERPARRLRRIGLSVHRDEARNNGSEEEQQRARYGDRG